MGSAVAKDFQRDDGIVEVYMGCVHAYSKDDDGGLYSIRYEDGDGEDMNSEEYCDAQELAASRSTSSEELNVDKTVIFRKKVMGPLEQLTDIIRNLGQLGPTWTHKWSDTDSKALQRIKLPLVQSKKIFRVANSGKLQAAVDIVVDESRLELRADWKKFLEHYLVVIEILTRSVEYESGDIDRLETNIDIAYAKLIAIAGIQGMTNYFHYLGSGHIVWLTRVYGNYGD